MMNTIKNMIRLTVCVFAVLVLGGCFSHWQGDTAKIVISFGGSGRATYDTKDFSTHQKLEHKIVLTSETEKPLNFSFTGGTSFETEVMPGNWNVRVDSWLGSEIYATGSKDVVLKIGQNNETIEMHQAFLVKFDSNDGGGTVQSIVVKARESITLPNGNGLSRTGYVFGGWNTNDKGTGAPYSAGSTYKPDGNVTLYAVWIEVSPAYTITFNANGGSGMIQPITVNAGEHITLPDGSGFSKAGYAFGGWNTNDKGTGDDIAAGVPYTPLASITLYAKWNFISVVPGSDLAAKLTWLSTNAVEGSDYIFTVDKPESLMQQDLFYDNKKITITLKGDTQEQTVSLSGNGSLFTINSGVTLILDNITLKGHGQNDTSLIIINSGGLEMNAGSKITSNTASNPASIGGGVTNYDYGTLIMKDGGEISGNTCLGDGVGGVMSFGNFIMEGGEISSNHADGHGTGGVWILGNFTMEDGKITRNTTAGSSSGGGVFVFYRAIFTMKKGEISGNHADGSGGGVVVFGAGTFNMDGGAIYNNTATYHGGGVYVMGETNIYEDDKEHVTPAGIFTMSGGDISGNTAQNGGGGIYVKGKFTKEATGGTISGNKVGNGEGKAVFAWPENGNPQKRDSDVRSNEALSFDGTTDPPTLGGVWND